MNLSIVVPVYRGGNLVEPLVAELSRCLPSFARRYEIILVNDGSPDNSWGVIQRLTRNHKNVKGIRLMRNYGQHNATLCGVRGRAMVHHHNVSGCSHRPEDIPLLLEKFEHG